MVVFLATRQHLATTLTDDGFGVTCLSLSLVGNHDPEPKITPPCNRPPPSKGVPGFLPIKALGVHFDITLWGFRFSKLEEVLVVICLQREEAVVPKWGPFCRFLSFTLDCPYFLTGGVWEMCDSCLLILSPFILKKGALPGTTFVGVPLPVSSLKSMMHRQVVLKINSESFCLHLIKPPYPSSLKWKPSQAGPGLVTICKETKEKRQGS